MTSDAKIGLLLGLIFIFIIAFILNGPHGLGGRANSNQATAQDLSNLASSSTDAGLAQPVGVASDLGSPITTSDDIRYRVPLSGGNLGGMTEQPAVTPESTDEVAAVTPDSVTPAPEPATADTSLVEIGENPVAANPADNVVSNQRGSTERTVTAESQGTEYTVVSGDSPAKIAMKFYGPVEGNRLVNVDRLMTANNIKDATKLKVGQKIIIPALPRGPETLISENPGTFTRVDGTTPRTETRTPTSASDTSATGNTKEYVVAQGDSLWTIAAKNLGSGIRYKEILKLNSGKLGSDGSRLAVGMKLRIPAQ